MRKVVRRTPRWSARRRVKRQGPGRSFSPFPLWLKYQPTRHHGGATSSASQMAIGGGRWTMNGGTSMRHGNEPTKWPHALLQMLQEHLVWVNADNWEEHGTSIVHHCLYLNLAGWRRWQAWQAQAIRLALYHKARETRGNNFSNKRTQTQPADWLALVENGRYWQGGFPSAGLIVSGALAKVPSGAGFQKILLGQPPGENRAVLS